MTLTWKEFLDSDLTLEEYIQPQVAARLEKETWLTPEAVERAVENIQSETHVAERRITELEFEKLVAQNAVLGGVLPKAVHHIAASAAELFELRDGMLKVRNGETEPGDPLTPLQFETWLAELRKEMSSLFVAPTPPPPPGRE